jgi:hypothetical protein
VGLAVIPNVRTDITYGGGIPEGFLVARTGRPADCLPLASNPRLVDYLAKNTGYHIVQHGCTHEFVDGNCEFEQNSRVEIARRVEEGREHFARAGLPAPETFVAPYDRFTRRSLLETARRFRLISTGWFELGRLPRRWWAGYVLKRLLRRAHWRASGTILLTHPGCHLSYQRPRDRILHEIRESIGRRRLTVLVTHWWEFFRGNKPDEALIEVLHETADFLGRSPDIRVVTFGAVIQGRVPLN